MRSALTAALAAVTVLTAPGCAKMPPASVDPMAPAMLEVDNQSFYDMNVYVLRNGMRIRLGTVPGNGRAVFELPRTVVGLGIPVRFVADPIGSSRAPYSEEIAIAPGDTVMLTIPPS